MAEFGHKGERILDNVHFGSYQEKIDKDILANISWLYGKSKKQHERLKSYLTSLDKSKRVDPNSERRNTVHHGVNVILDMIQRRLTEQDPRLTGTLVPMGSANNHTKIGDSDESDFIYELNLNSLLKGRGTCESYDKDFGNVVMQIDGDLDLEIVKKRTKFPLDSANDVIILDKENIDQLFRDNLSKVLSELQLPPGWRHGGFNKPHFSYIHRQGPSSVLQFDYLDTSDQVPLSISVDCVPMIRIRIPADVPLSKLNSFLVKETKVEDCWMSIEDTGASLLFGRAEEKFLQKYSPESTSKTLIRISKALRIFLLVYSPKYPTKEFVQKVLKFVKQTKLGRNETDVVFMPDFVITRSDAMIDVPGVEDYITYSDLGETIGDECMVKSYYIKQVVLMMMMVDESHGRDWTNDDLPDLVITVFRLIKDRITRYSYPFIKISLVEVRFSVPLEETKKTTTRLLPMLPRAEERVTDVEGKRTFQTTNPKFATSPYTEERQTDVEGTGTFETTNSKFAMSPHTEEWQTDVKNEGVFEATNPNFSMSPYTEEWQTDVKDEGTFEATNPNFALLPHTEERQIDAKDEGTFEAINPNFALLPHTEERQIDVKDEGTFEAINPKFAMLPLTEERQTDFEDTGSVEVTNPKCVISPPKEERQSDVEWKDTQIYQQTLLAFKEGKVEFRIPVRFIQSRISNIFQLFRSICEEQNSAEIVFYKHLGPSRSGARLVTKKEYEEMKKETLGQNEALSVADTDPQTDSKTKADTHMEKDTNLDKPPSSIAQGNP